MGSHLEFGEDTGMGDTNSKAVAVFSGSGTERGESEEATADEMSLSQLLMETWPNSMRRFELS